jgi:hypothetical protein
MPNTLGTGVENRTTANTVTPTIPAITRISILEVRFISWSASGNVAQGLWPRKIRRSITSTNLPIYYRRKAMRAAQAKTRRACTNSSDELTPGRSMSTANVPPTRRASFCMSLMSLSAWTEVLAFIRNYSLIL